MIKWEKIDRSENSEGTTITYRGVGTDFIIQSRKRHIPHAGGVGTWDHTTYWVLRNGKELKQRYSLKDAKEYAEEALHNDKREALQESTGSAGRYPGLHGKHRG